jgi:hypothetical protein
MTSLFDTDLPQQQRDAFAETAELLAMAARKLARHLRAGEDREASVSLVFMTSTGGRLIDELSGVFSRAIDTNANLRGDLEATLQKLLEGTINDA